MVRGVGVLLLHAHRLGLVVHRLLGDGRRGLVVLDDAREGGLGLGVVAGAEELAARAQVGGTDVRDLGGGLVLDQAVGPEDERVLVRPLGVSVRRKLGWGRQPEPPTRSADASPSTGPARPATLPSQPERFELFTSTPPDQDTK